MTNNEHDTTDEQQEAAGPETPEEPDLADTLVQQAERAASRLEEANTRMEENIKTLRGLKVRERLGGRAEANTGQQEESPEDYADRMLKGG